MGYGVAMATRCYTHLSAEDCETVSLGLTHGPSLRARANVLGRAPSTVSRESARNRVRGQPSRACTAQTQAAARARQPRRPRTLLDPWRWQYVQTQRAEGDSPEQIAGRLNRASPDDMRKPLSAETISVGLSVLPRGTLRSELLAARRQARKRAALGREGRIAGSIRAPRQRGHPHRAGPLGRRSHQRHSQWVGRRHPGGADHPPGHSGQDGRDGCPECP